MALGWYLNLGVWAMLHDPIHFTVFIIICTLLPILGYTAIIMLSLYNTLKEAYIDVSIFEAVALHIWLLYSHFRQFLRS